MMHESDEILKASRAMAQMIVKLQQQKHEGASSEMLCYQLDDVAAQANMILRELDGENCGDC